MSRYVRSLVAAQHNIPKAKQLSTVHNEPMLTALVRTPYAEMLWQEGCPVLASWNDIHVASIPLSKIEYLVSLPQIKRIEAGQPCHITNDSCSYISRVSSPVNAPLHNDIRSKYGLTGRGINFGIMDIGFDLTHPTFKNREDGSLRIKALWDQLDWSEDGEPAPYQVNQIIDTLIDQTVPGRLFLNEESLKTKAHSADASIATHGTHTCATAVGCGSSTYPSASGTSTPTTSLTSTAASSSVFGRWAGMASNADIYMVCNAVSSNSSVLPEGTETLYTTATDLLGFKFLFDQAEAMQQPCVISFSEGSHENLYDQQLYEEVLNKMVGPGRILCVSAGNEGQKGSYLHKPAGEDEAGAFISSSSSQAYYTLRSTHPTQISLSFYQGEGSDMQRYDWTYDTNELTNYPDSVYMDTLRIDDAIYMVGMAVYPDCYDATHLATELLLVDILGQSFNTHHTPVALRLIGKDNDIELFESGGELTTNPADPSLNNFTYDHNILFPGSVERVICVGSTAHVQFIEGIRGDKIGRDFGKGGELAYFSSKGPTMSGISKPDVVAPGTTVQSAASSYWLTDPVQYWLTATEEHEGRLYGWAIDSGTSMSTPVVAGIIALWLELCPTLSPEDIKDVLAHTCTHPDSSLDYPNNLFGYGQIDALAGADYISSQYLGIEETKSSVNLTSTKRYDIHGLTVTDGYRGIIIEQSGQGYRKILKR